jgi:Rod binding domain-containing protein
MRTDIQVDIPRDELARRKITGPGRRKDAPDTTDVARFRKVAKEFESILVEQMVKEMRTGDMKSKLFGTDSGMDTYREMLDGEFVRLMGEKGGIGLADFMVRNTPKELIGHSVTDKDLMAAKAADNEVDRVSSFAGANRQSLQTGLPTPGSWGVIGRSGH